MLSAVSKKENELTKEKKDEMIGGIAAILSTGAFAPQVWRVWSHWPQAAPDVSLITFLMLTVATLLWFTYGVKKKSISIKLANGTTFLLCLAVLTYKLLCG